VIMLVPEISLTTQTIERFLSRFGSDKIAVLHSKLTRVQRYNEWLRVKQGKVKIVIGARSAVFAPFDNIGAIIIDEEHETTYKSDMTPKYDTVEVAIQRSRESKAVVILGSATPSLISTYKSESGSYERLLMTRRYNEAPLPSVKVVDMREELKNGNKSIFSLELYHQIERCLEDKRQVILFLNRRGYSTFLSCRYCGYVMRCDECSISLTFHKSRNEVVCHFCGNRKKVPRTCPECNSKYIRYFGTGTEKVEEMALQAFPNAKIDRLDLDTSQKRGSIDRIIGRFAKGKTDILIGTQLVAKGLDFANVGLVGIISADISLNIPDYRSPERTFQLITQAAGRAGRGEEAGKVIIQTYTPEHYAIQSASVQDYYSFYKTEIAIRRSLGYPPFSDLIQLIISAEDEDLTKDSSEKIKEVFLKRVGAKHKGYILGPRPAPMNKIKELYRYQMLIKCFPEHWELYKEALKDIKTMVVKSKRKVYFSIDVNPYGFL
ncbi:MAG: primosomal protein N', partial [Clostridiales bacterium]|nr:primosomal protein N' [Clostridiales bacterium]